MRSTLFCGAAIAALIIPAAALAQSTGQVEAERNDDIVITGSLLPAAVDGVQNPKGVKTRGVLTQEIISQQVPGQSINDTINLLPGVSFQNNDPYGSSGGTLTIRGFDSSRISQTFDGLPLNDTGNYQLYSNQQLDPELIEQVNVNLGTTDVDSPTAAASGSTVNYRSVNPTEEFGARALGSVGDFSFYRGFIMLNTGNFTKFGTRAWFAASHSENDNPYQRTSATDKNQYNFKVYQPLGNNGDFISIAGNYNVNRNGNFSSVPLRQDLTQSPTNTAPRVVGSASSNRFPLNTSERDYTALIRASCATGTDLPQAGVADVPNTCGTFYDQSFNPSNNGNIRINSRFTLADGLILTVDPSFQYVRANGGTGAVKGNEGFYTRDNLNGRTPITAPIFGYIGGQPYFGGVDLNGDADLIDTPVNNLATGALASTGNGVELYAPSLTRTRRWGVIANLIYDFTPDQTIRINYSHDYGNHRQTGEVTVLRENGYTSDVFPQDSALLDATGKPIQKRNRQSFAILDQVSGQYRGTFMDALTVELGVRAPFFKRNLTNYCVTETGGTFVDCFNDAASQTAFLNANPAYVAPTSRRFSYSRVLPSGGLTYQFTPQAAIYASYTKGLQVPGTDNLYQSFAFTSDRARPTPETTDNFDAGVRYTSRRVQAQLAGWYTSFQNRLASSYDPELDTTIFRNLGTVHKYGVDANLAYVVIPQQLTAYIFGSYLKSKILDNVQTGECTAANVTAGVSTGVGTCTTVGQPIFALTGGKREGGSPTFTVGGRIQAQLGPVEFGAQAKHTGPRYVNDQNLPIVPSGFTTPVFGAKTSPYTTVDLNARVSLEPIGLNDKTYLQFNVTNVFDEFYVAGFTPNTATTAIPFAYIGAPRTFSASFNMQF